MKLLRVCARPVRPAPLLERRVIEPGALSQDIGKGLVPDPAGVATVLVCLVDLGHIVIIPNEDF